MEMGPEAGADGENWKIVGHSFTELEVKVRGMIDNGCLHY